MLWGPHIIPTLKQNNHLSKLDQNNHPSYLEKYNHLSNLENNNHPSNLEHTTHPFNLEHTTQIWSTSHIHRNLEQPTHKSNFGANHPSIQLWSRPTIHSSLKQPTHLPDFGSDHITHQPNDPIFWGDHPSMPELWSRPPNFGIIRTSTQPSSRPPTHPFNLGAAHGPT